MTESMKKALETMTAKFPNQFFNSLQVQDYLSKEAFDLHKSASAITKYEQERLQLNEKHEIKSKELMSVNEHIPIIENWIQKAKSELLIENFKTQLNTEKNKQFVLEEWMRNNNPNDLNNEEILYEVHKVHYEFRKAIALRLAEWFAAGNAGPGTVTFMEKEYTAV